MATGDDDIKISTRPRFRYEIRSRESACLREGKPVRRRETGGDIVIFYDTRVRDCTIVAQCDVTGILGNMEKAVNSNKTKTIEDII